MDREQQKNIAGLVVKGFTLLEMIVAMVIGAIIITLIYGIFLQLQTVWGNFHRNQERILTLFLFKKTIDADIEKSEYVQTSDGKNYVLFSQNDTVNYSLDSMITRRELGHTDTFELTVRSIRPGYVNGLDAQGIVNSLSFNIVAPINFEKLTIYKNYTSGNLLNLPDNQVR